MDARLHRRNVQAAISAGLDQGFRMVILQRRSAGGRVRRAAASASQHSLQSDVHSFSPSCRHAHASMRRGACASSPLQRDDSADLSPVVKLAIPDEQEGRECGDWGADRARSHAFLSRPGMLGRRENREQKRGCPSLGGLGWVKSDRVSPYFSLFFAWTTCRVARSPVTGQACL